MKFSGSAARNMLRWMLLVFIQTPVIAQSFTHVKTIAREISFFTTDKLGHAYLVSRDGLYKYNPQGTEVAAFADKSLGTLSSVDATDALKLMLFSRDFRKVYLLDDRLSIRSQFDLGALGLDQPALICMSRHDGYWVFDALQRRLLKFDTKLNPAGEGELFSHKLTSLDPDFMVESSQWIFLHDPGHGVLMADRYGTYYKVLRELNARHFQCEGEKLTYFDGEHLVRLDTRSGVSETIPIPELEGTRQVRIEKNRLYISTPGAFHIYSF